MSAEVSKIISIKIFKGRVFAGHSVFVDNQEYFIAPFDDLLIFKITKRQLTHLKTIKVSEEVEKEMETQDGFVESVAMRFMGWLEGDE